MTGHIFIYGEIGTSVGQVSLKSVKSQIDQQKDAEDFILHMVSPGGDVFQGYAIYNAIKNTGKKFTGQIEGLCASIATLIIFGCDRIVMNRTGELMVHNPKISDLKPSDAYDLRHVANQLDTIKNLLVDVAGERAQRNGKPMSKEKLWELYDNETWLTAQQAEQFGFVDEVVDAMKAVAKVDLNSFKMEKSLFKTLVRKFQNLLEVSKIKNEFTETLQDGTVVIVMSEDGAWEGKQVIREDGSPLDPGDYVLASGKTITVGDNSTITTVKEAESPAAKEEQNEMDNKIKELEAQLAEAKAAKETAEATAQAALKEAVSAKAETSKFQNRVTNLEKDFLALKEAAGKTLGDDKPLPTGPVFKNADGSESMYDPMAEFVKRKLKARSGQ